MTSGHLRLACESDIPGILELIALNPDTILARTESEIRELLPTSWVVVEGKRVVGCCVLEVYGPKICEVRSLAVSTDRRKSGYGRLLVEAAVAEAQRRNIREILAVTSAPEFFRKLNFGPSLNEKFALFWGGK
jgi:N-acetylglutamate synthase-like GNAT family acetyltransferase